MANKDVATTHFSFSTIRRFSFALCVFLCLIAACSVSTTTPTITGPPTVRENFAVGFSPGGTSLDIILRSIGEARESILVAAYSFTSKPISEALAEAHHRGVVVKVIADAKSNSGKYSAVPYLASQNIPVRINGNYAIFHHKFLVIDGRHIETGSFNFSAAAANKNAENVLLLRDVPELAGIYTEEWKRLWAEGEDVLPSVR